MRRARIVVMGVATPACLVGRAPLKAHIDQVVDAIGSNCARIERLEIRWDTETIRFSDKSSKFVDVLRNRCAQLRTVTLADGEYYELVRSNFVRAERPTVVRTTTLCLTSTLPLLAHFRDLSFN